MRAAVSLCCLLAGEAVAHANRVGVESDVVGWASGGYHGSAWFGTERVRVRLVKARFYPPSFTVADGFTDLRNDAWEFFVDVTWRRPRRGDRFEGIWSGVGLELYERSIRDERTDTTAAFDALELALRAGYIWRPFDAGFYVNPWFGLNVRLAGDEYVPFADGAIYSAPRVNPLASLKVGWQF